MQAQTNVIRFPSRRVVAERRQKRRNTIIGLLGMASSAGLVLYVGAQVAPLLIRAVL